MTQNYKMKGPSYDFNPRNKPKGSDEYDNYPSSNNYYSYNKRIDTEELAIEALECIQLLENSQV